MKPIILSLTCLFLGACATDQERIAALYHTQTDRAKEAARRDQEETQFEQAIPLLSTSLSKEQVIALLGQPKSVELINGEYQLLYSHRRTPMIVGISEKTNKVTSWRSDRDTLARRERGEAQRAEFQFQADRDADARRAQAMQNISNSFAQPKQSRCVTTKGIGEQLVTNCD